MLPVGNCEAELNVSQVETIMQVVLYFLDGRDAEAQADVRAPIQFC